MKSYFSILLASAALLLAGCAKTDADDVPAGGKSVAFITSMPDNHAVRGTLVETAADIADMGVFCAATGTTDWSVSAALDKMFDQRLNNTGGAWVYPEGEEQYWEAETMGDRYTFFAYAPYATESNGIEVDALATAGVPTLTYTVPTTTADQPDLMVAVARKNMRPTNSPVALQMKHALTSVSFKIVADDAGKQLTDISITGVSMTGTLPVDGEAVTWTPGAVVSETDLSALLDYDNGQSYYTIPTDAMASPIAGDGYLMMIPQTLTAAAKVTLTFADENTCVIDLGDHTWDVGKNVVYQITLRADGEIVVSPDAVTIPYAAGVGGQFRVTCQEGAQEADLPWSFSVPDGGWLKLSKSSTATWSDASTTLTGSGSTTIYLVAQENSNVASNRTTAVTLDGTTEEVVTVTQLRKIINGGTVMSNSYVGAFWKNEQTGERVIKINVGTNSGAWSASVLWMDGQWGSEDGIVLAAGKSPDLALYSANPGDAESFQVEGTSTSVSGTASGSDPILFRIGLKSEYTPTDTYPARYAVVELSYNNHTKTQLLYLRQGEGDDYLMRPGDAGLDVGGRTLAAKLSPYNLTHPDFKGVASTIPKITAAARSGEMTDYPSQAGAFYKWAETAGVVAYNPAVPATNGVTGWDANNSVTTYWGQFVGATGKTTAETYDGCPEGYRRWNDGSQDGPVTLVDIAANSEIGQSLFVNPPSGYTTNNIDNSAWGYYADGFFDRRTITNTAVSPDNSAVAYNGRLFYNPTTNASLFFPAPGYRNQSNGGLSASGLNGHYWSSSTTGLGASHGITIGNNSALALRTTNDRDSGFSVRCVAAR